MAVSAVCNLLLPTMMSDILDRLFGKPKQTTDMNVGASTGTAVQVTVGTPEAAEGLRHALATGAQPGDPDKED